MGQENVIIHYAANAKNMAFFFVEQIIWINKSKFFGDKKNYSIYNAEVLWILILRTMRLWLIGSV